MNAVRPHDLLWGMTPDLLPADAPWVAVGLRGRSRAQRFAARMPLAQVVRRVAPERLRWQGDTDLPALQATTEIYTLSLHDALPIYPHCRRWRRSPLSSTRRGGAGGQPAVSASSWLAVSRWCTPTAIWMCCCTHRSGCRANGRVTCWARWRQWRAGSMCSSKPRTGLSRCANGPAVPARCS